MTEEQQQRQVSAPKAKPRWTDLATLGFVLSGLGPVLLLVAVLAWGLETEGETAFFGIIIAFAALGALLSRVRHRSAKIASIVVAALMFLSLWWTIFGLFAGPASFFDFMSGVLVMPGALMAMIASISSFVAARRGNVGTHAVRGERRAVRTAIVVVATAAVLSGILTVTSRSSVEDASAAAATVTMKDFEFDPKEVSVAGGSAVLVKNDDPFLHTFTIDQLGVDETLTLGSAKLVTVPAKPGVYILYCKPHTEDPEKPGTNDMAGTLRVT
jgi:plastocyanin